MATSPARTKLKSPSVSDVDPTKKSSASDSMTARTTTIRLPFMTASFTRPPRPAPVVVPWTPQASIGQVADALHLPIPRSRWALYGGAVVLGALEVVEWPVALLVVAGTYLTDRATTTASPTQSPDSVLPAAAEQHTAGA